jgi:hypothetical protein
MVFSQFWEKITRNQNTYPEKLLFRNKDKIKKFSAKQKQKPR